MALLEVVELPRRRGDEKDAALREKEGLRSLLEVVGTLWLLFVCAKGGRGAGTVGMAGIVASGPSRVVGLDDDGAKEEEGKLSVEGGGRCMVQVIQYY